MSSSFWLLINTVATTELIVSDRTDSHRPACWSVQEDSRTESRAAADIETAAASLMRDGVTACQLMGCSASAHVGLPRSTVSAAAVDADDDVRVCCSHTPSRQYTARHADQRNGNYIPHNIRSKNANKHVECTCNYRIFYATTT